jgi:peptidoglycan hydrolase-like protein with peptidoglycan-binding domain
MKVLPVLVALSLLGVAAFADDRVREAQTELKRQGFYYGEVDGQEGAETSAAIRRFQIRNGLEVTGKLDVKTLDALDADQAASELPVAPPSDAPAPPATPPAPVPPAPAPPVTKKPAPPVNLRRDDTVEDTDRAFLHREETKRSRAIDDDHVVPPPRTIPEPTADLAMLFAETPYATAPREVQEQTLRRAQTLLADRGFYREAIDGDPGPATEEAILTFQRSRRLKLTGRLDLATLGELRLLPGRTPIRPFFSPSTSQRVYRGVIVE